MALRILLGKKVLPGLMIKEKAIRIDVTETKRRKEEMINAARKRSLFALLIIIGLLHISSSCLRSNSFSFNEELPLEGWSKFHKPVFTAEITDTLNAYNILLSLRNSHEYPYRNIFLFITTSSPEGVSIKDTIEYQLADEKGSWYGKGLGDIHNLAVSYKSNILFPSAGEYIFKIEQGMRTDNLKGILDVGLIIRKKEK